MQSRDKTSFWDMVHDESAKLETLHLLKRTIPTSFVTVICLSLVIGYLAAPYTHWFILTGWVCMLFMTFAARLYLSREFDAKFSQSDISLTQWLSRFRFATMSTGLVWALGETIILYAGVGFVYEHYVFLTFCAVGFFVGAMLALSVDRVTMVGSCVPSVLPLLLAFVQMGDTTAISTGAALALFLTYIYLTAIRHGNSLHENLYLRFRAVDDEKKLKQVLNNSPIGACISHLHDDSLLFYNDRYREMLKGFVNSQQVLRSLMPKDDYNAIVTSLNRGGSVKDKLLCLKSDLPDQPTKWLLASFTRFDQNHKPAVLSWYYDITDRKEMEEQAEYMAYHDALTQLPNRILFNDRLSSALHQAKRDEKYVAVMFLDLDGFKQINDEYGHHVGDELLKDVANRLSAILRESDTVARLGGDEFGVVMLVSSEDDVKQLAQKLREVIDEAYEIEGLLHRITVSIGIAMYPEHGETENVLLKHADAAMYLVKRQGRNDISFYR